MPRPGSHRCECLVAEPNRSVLAHSTANGQLSGPMVDC